MVRNLLLAGVFAVLICLVLLNITSCSISSTLKSSMEQEENRRVLEWQQVIVYDIIDRHSDDATPGVADAAIKKEYVEEAAKSKINVPKEEPADHVVKKILLDLSKNGAIERTKDGYIRKRPTNAGNPNDPAVFNKNKS